MSSIAYTSPMITQDCPVLYPLEVPLYLEDPSMECWDITRDIL